MLNKNLQARNTQKSIKHSNTAYKRDVIWFTVANLSYCNHAFICVYIVAQN